MSGNRTLTIEELSNGWTVHGHNGEEDTRLVFEAAINLDVDPEAFSRLLWYVIEYFNVEGTRYDAKRIKVVVEQGDKWEG